jgi:hypothetical protein
MDGAALAVLVVLMATADLAAAMAATQRQRWRLARLRAWLPLQMAPRCSLASLTSTSCAYGGLALTAMRCGPCLH